MDEEATKFMECTILLLNIFKFYAYLSNKGFVLTTRKLAQDLPAIATTSVRKLDFKFN